MLTLSKLPLIQLAADLLLVKHSLQIPHCQPIIVVEQVLPAVWCIHGVDALQDPLADMSSSWKSWRFVSSVLC